MKRARHDGYRRHAGSLARIGLTVAAGFLLTGCQTGWWGGHPLDSGYEPSNVYRKSATLPAQVKRVALLPLSAPNSTGVLEAGVETLEPALHEELEKTKRFEVITVSREQLRQWTGQAVWKSEDRLPSNFFERVREGTGCDAVYFAQLTRYQPYQPIVEGWKLSLVQAGEADKAGAQILWSADEVFDAGNPEVARAARTYYSQHFGNQGYLSDSGLILNSPRQFGHYSLDSLLATLPAR